MRLDFVLTGWARRPKGGYKVIYEYANELARGGDEVTIHHCAGLLASVPGKSLPSLFWLRAIRATVEPWARRLVGRAPIPWMEIDSRVRLRFHLRAPHRLRTDLVIATAVDTAPTVERLARRASAPGVYFIQHFEDWAAPKEWVEQTWRLPLKKIVISDWLSSIGDDLGVKTTLVHNGFAAERFPRGAPIAERPRLVLCLLSTTPYKRPDLVRAIFERLHTTDPSIVCAAFGVSERPSDLPPHVVYRRNPAQAELQRLYQDARVFICTSDYEGFGLPPAEALLSGASVVSTDIGGVRSYARNIFIFAPVGSAEALSAAALDLLGDPERAQSMVDAGYPVLAARTIEAAAREFRAALVEAVSSATTETSVQ
ncbi:glycosyltransferase family 4 protein [Rathayibacter iranicus]|uniref:Glycosyl transferase family 1 domain-containing protein n=3 Tax=Rathayibacter iranicus TaxID=59737 RepID=A0AAD1EM14_9MICO|nr:glycosyltransferase family 4 protein [Rathayibacter iranicus]AZZ55632.1 hypothetical protein C7V51_06840 [Rathayibacter iranicus]MWV31109.1 glycosyltransferase [Rathayibacter iranicus NCPPB 2253 = VKM Ac-1602]PPI47902.1 hypothetical protein C5E09_05890 [Rathayibacter iranicus]PPI61053.1 hypothetical protein C5E08_06820 [Rathayibacter iranicus]PWJ63945.1 glycosyltransferase involved in cell wall biosynthesis [Rathayibacter iranicus NCPPB 2253 = VKM Ac-1602]